MTQEPNNTILVRTSELPGTIREAIRAVLKARQVTSPSASPEDLLREIANEAARAVWACRVLPSGTVAADDEGDHAVDCEYRRGNNCDCNMEGRRVCCGNVGALGENGREYGQGIP